MLMRQSEYVVSSKYGRLILHKFKYTSIYLVLRLITVYTLDSFQKMISAMIVED